MWEPCSLWEVSSVRGWSWGGQKSRMGNLREEQANEQHSSMVLPPASCHGELVSAVDFYHSHRK